MYRTRPTARSRTFGLIQRPLPFAVVGILTGLRRHDPRTFDLPFGFRDENKVAAAEALRVLETLGGVLDKHGHQVTFDYEARPVMDEVIASGCLPDRVSHQYYPIPPAVAAAVVAQAAIEPGHTILEPSAGQGALAALSPRESTVCVEVSHLHGLVLQGKGFTVVEADFLVWAQTTTRRFDRVVINPPFS